MPGRVACDSMQAARVDRVLKERKTWKNLFLKSNIHGSYTETYTIMLTDLLLTSRGRAFHV